MYYLRMENMKKWLRELNYPLANSFISMDSYITKIQKDVMIHT